MAVSEPVPPGPFAKVGPQAAHPADGGAVWERSLSLKLTVSARLLTKDFDHNAGNVGITRAQWSTIAAVAGAEGATQRKIATMLDIGEAAAGRQIDRLCEEGWLERRQDPNDRRAHCIHLTPAATPVLEKLTMLGAQQERLTFAGLSDQELTTLGKMLDRVIENLNDSLARDGLVAGSSAGPLEFGGAL
ncbi:MarR family winged helix-turn-helix transcriptional regulator [uncultured Sphingomonas sp.]|uniref:MarR family winged helix-turn-helix transcriptional regulator n=1 Tax=uncultured Sphingomonas sp. TaxID=158754 RepID=UPI0035CAFF30